MGNVSVLNVCVFVMIKPTEWGNSIFVCLSMGIPTDIIFLLHFQGGGGRGLGVINKVLYGELLLRSKPLTFYIPFLRQKVPLSYTSIDKWYPFHLAS